MRKYGTEHQRVQLDDQDPQGLSRTALSHLETAEELPEVEGGIFADRANLDPDLNQPEAR
jgi:hypothetical protein